MKNLFIVFCACLLIWGCSSSQNGEVHNRMGETCLFKLVKGELHNNGATPWFTEIELGTPKQHMTVMMDTGTSNFWVTSSDCTSKACQTKKFTFDRFSSVSCDSVPGSGWQSNDLGSWGEFHSLAVQDTISFQTTKESENKFKMKFLVAKLQDAPGSKNWYDLDMCGGIGFPVIFKNPAKTNNPASLLPVLMKMGLVSYPLISFWSDQSSGGCLVGGVDSSRFIPHTENIIPLTQVATRINLWTVRLDQFYKNSSPMLDSPINLALDTGSSRFKGSPEIINNLISEITEKSDGKHLPTTFTNAELLNEFPKVTLSINGHQYTLTPQDYIWKIADSPHYSLQFQPLDIGDDNTILVGSVFLDHLYSAFVYTADNSSNYRLKGKYIHLYKREIQYK